MSTAKTLAAHSNHLCLSGHAELNIYVEFGKLLDKPFLLKPARSVISGLKAEFTNLDVDLSANHAIRAHLFAHRLSRVRLELF
jgi:hypothetical protein